MATKLSRWICPNACGGVLAPSRPRKDDVRRYCLPCSAKIGRLVERIAPALEAKRKIARERGAVKAKKKAEGARAKWMVARIDAERYMKRLALLPVYGGRKGEVWQRINDPRFQLVIERGTRGRRKLGHCTGWEIKLHTTPGWGESTLREVLMHELMHIRVLPKRGKERITNLFGQGRRRVRTVQYHTPEFHRKMVVAWRQSIRRFGEPNGSGPVGKWQRETVAAAIASM